MEGNDDISPNFTLSRGKIWSSNQRKALICLQAITIKLSLGNHYIKSLRKSKVIGLEIDTLDPFPFCAGPWVWTQLPQGPCGGLEAESSVLSSHEVYNSIFIASLPNRVYGATGIHLVKNADPLYEFLMVKEERLRPLGDLVKWKCFFFLISLSLSFLI